MHEAIAYKFDKDFVKLGAYQFLGGLVGFAILFYSAYSSGFGTFETFLLYTLLVLFFGYSVLCSILCLRRRASALKFSFINQATQVIAIAIKGYGYKYVAGIYLSLSLDFTTGFDWSLGFGISRMLFQLNTDSPIALVEINFIALAIVFWIYRLRNKIKDEELSIATEEIGESPAPTF